LSTKLGHPARAEAAQVAGGDAEALAVVAAEDEEAEVVAAAAVAEAGTVAIVVAAVVAEATVAGKGVRFLGILIVCRGAELAPRFFVRVALFRAS